VWPVFVVDGHEREELIESMPGQSRCSVDVLCTKLKPVVESGVNSVLLFGVLDDHQKDEQGTGAYAEDGVVQNAVRALRHTYHELTIMTDVCLCAYTSHGHCGPLHAGGDVDNDAANGLLAKVAVSHAAAGADVVAPSAMMDGQVATIREALDADGFMDTILMSYSSKFASSMYGPFREAEKSAPQHGDRQGYQASYTDLRTALRESEEDEAEGADILMVKPSLFYLDVIARIRESTNLPIAAYNVSGEYAMLHATAEKGWGDLYAMARESIAALSRAGTDIFISYWANQYSQLKKESHLASKTQLGLPVAALM
jgi:porphobilinogen synthase